MSTSYGPWRSRTRWTRGCNRLCLRGRLGLDGPEPPHRGLAAQAGDRDRDDRAGPPQRRLGGEHGRELDHPAQPVLAAARERDLRARAGEADPAGLALEVGREHAAPRPRVGVADRGEARAVESAVARLRQGGPALDAALEAQAVGLGLGPPAQLGRAVGGADPQREAQRRRRGHSRAVERNRLRLGPRGRCQGWRGGESSRIRRTRRCRSALGGDGTLGDNGALGSDGALGSCSALCRDGAFGRRRRSRRRPERPAGPRRRSPSLDRWNPRRGLAGRGSNGRQPPSASRRPRRSAMRPWRAFPRRKRHGGFRRPALPRGLCRRLRVGEPHRGHLLRLPHREPPSRRCLSIRASASSRRPGSAPITRSGADGASSARTCSAPNGAGGAGQVQRTSLSSAACSSTAMPVSAAIAPARRRAGERPAGSAGCIGTLDNMRLPTPHPP